jgi:hypothetical protein
MLFHANEPAEYISEHFSVFRRFGSPQFQLAYCDGVPSTQTKEPCAARSLSPMRTVCCRFSGIRPATKTCSSLEAMDARWPPAATQDASARSQVVPKLELGKYLKHLEYPEDPRNSPTLLSTVPTGQEMHVVPPSAEY